jgi:trimeric autotransporter adhesin
MTRTRLVSRLAVLLVLLSAILPGLASSQALTHSLQALTQIPVTNQDGQVHVVTTSGSTVYVGGNFDYLGPATGGAALLDATTGAADLTFPQINGVVAGIVSDGAGGWYICGGFTYVGSSAHNAAVHIKADLTVDDTWNPGITTNAFAQCIAFGGSSVYIVWNSTTFRAYDATTGAQLPFNAGSVQVNAMVVSGSTLYVGGGFSSIGGQSRNNLAALDATTGNALPWVANVTGGVADLALDGSTLYVAGGFSGINGFSRNNLGAVDAASAAVLPWNPNVDFSVGTIAVSGGMVYAGGLFTMVGLDSRRNLAAISTSTGLATSWDPSPNSQVLDVAVAGTTVYVGGWFTTIGGQTRLRVAGIDTGTGVATGWHPEAADRVFALAPSGSKILTGTVMSAGGKARNGLASFDATTGAISGWDPHPDGDVRAIATAGSTVYVGGSFANVGGQPRKNLAALSATTGLATSWNPSPDNRVLHLVLSGSQIYVGGEFANIGATPRTNLAAIDLTSGIATSWNPAPNGFVSRILLSGGLVYVGGGFTNVGGQPRTGLAALSPTTALANGWNPSAGNVYGMSASGSTLYLFGLFTAAGGLLRHFLAAVDMSTGVATAFDPHMTYNEARGDIIVAGSKVYVAIGTPSGDPVSIGGQARLGLAELDPATGAATSWNPPLVPAVLAWGNCGLFVDGTVLYLGGDNLWLQPPTGTKRRNLVAWDLSSLVGVGDTPFPRSLSLSLDPNPTLGNARIRLMLTHDGRVHVGVFDLQGREVARLADGVLPAGSRELTWNGRTRSGKRESGVYFVTVDVGDAHTTKRLVVLH